MNHDWKIGDKGGFYVDPNGQFIVVAWVCANCGQVKERTVRKPSHLAHAGCEAEEVKE